MSDFDSLVVSSPSEKDFGETWFNFEQTLPKETRLRLNRILLYCVKHYGQEGAYKRLNNRSVSQILAEYPAIELKDVLEPEDLKLVASGEVDGMRWELYDSPSAATTEGERSDKQS